MDNETDQNNSSVLLAVAIVGWVAFIGVLVYGVLVYGPAKHKLGLEGALDPNALSEKAFPNGDPTFIPPTVLPITVVGVLVELNGQQLVINVPSLLLNQATKKKTFSVSTATKFFRRTFISSEVTEENGFQITGGNSEDEPISIANLQIGDDIEFTYQENAAGENEILELIVYS